MEQKDSFFKKHRVSAPVFWLHIGSLLLLFLSIMFWMIPFFKVSLLGARGNITGIALAFGGEMRIYHTTAESYKAIFQVNMVEGFNVAFWLFVAGFAIIILGTFLRATKKPTVYRSIIIAGAAIVVAGAVILFFARTLLTNSSQVAEIVSYYNSLKGIGYIFVSILGIVGSGTAVLGSFYA